jgi:hypothetical protein
MDRFQDGNGALAPTATFGREGLGRIGAVAVSEVRELDTCSVT